MRHLDVNLIAIVLLLIISASACTSQVPTEAMTVSEVQAEEAAAESETAAEEEAPAEEAAAEEEAAEVAVESEAAEDEEASSEEAVEADEEANDEEAAESEMVEQELEELDPSNFDENSINIDNEWWPLEPGTRLIYEGVQVEDGEEIPHRVVDTVTDLTKVINGVRTVVSLEEDYSDGELIEKEIAFHAQDKDGNVWHFGQYRETYDEVEFVGGRVWLVDLPEGAKAGIRMPAEPQLDAPGYSQGYAPPPFHWTDRARVYQMGQQTEVPTGSYDDVMVIEEWDQETEEGVFQLKYYARDVGVVRIGFRGPDPEQEEMELVEIIQLDPEALAEVRAEALEMEKRASMYGQTQAAEGP